MPALPGGQPDANDAGSTMSSQGFSHKDVLPSLGPCELWDKTLTASESVAHVPFSTPLPPQKTKSGAFHQGGLGLMASLV